MYITLISVTSVICPLRSDANAYFGHTSESIEILSIDSTCSFWAVGTNELLHLTLLGNRLKTHIIYHTVYGQFPEYQSAKKRVASS